jgi:hypothetical protein
MHKKIYISGKITGLTKEQIHTNFERAHACIKALRRLEDVEIFNPSKLEETMPDGTYPQFMKASLLMMLKCDEIYVMPGWESSKGANLEIQVAAACGLKINFL